MDCRDDYDHDASRWTRRELALLRRAVPDAIQVVALNHLGPILARGPDRAKLSAAQMLAVLDRIDPADERQELERTWVEIQIQTHPGPGTATVDPRVAEVVLRAATVYYLEQQGETLADMGLTTRWDRARRAGRDDLPRG